ncbi:hypothetical protein SAMN05661080_04807 [Modestobacter sp. DSM 44400]|uniref:hypothetical protein n=1 Tax=Modestobacter sp. DSM 44400 TaxID=1550230 RepID=UPI00089BB99A|nr:hypothetical protein [Modestobacter sp. DSM 44400]SDY85141.1 hypothetical protein SAMN05661080_04807 [Modestobacter sp. DSM 44400]
MRRTALFVLPVALALASCGGGGGDEQASANVPTSAEATSDSPDELDPTMCREPAFLEENTEFCLGGGYGESSGDSGLQTIELGTPYELTDFEDPASLETMTVNGVECDLTELPGGAPNPEWDGSDDVPRTIAAVADPGMTFCQVTATWQNTGKRPITGWTDFENLVTSDGTEYAEDATAEQATQYINEDCSPYVCDTINPGTPAFDVVKIYQVPMGTTPTGVQWPRSTINTGPEVLFLLE